jgi:hypothetical protein
MERRVRLVNWQAGLHAPSIAASADAIDQLGLGDSTGVDLDASHVAVRCGLGLAAVLQPSALR